MLTSTEFFVYDSPDLKSLPVSKNEQDSWGRFTRSHFEQRATSCQRPCSVLDPNQGSGIEAFLSFMRTNHQKLNAQTMPEEFADVVDENDSVVDRRTLIECMTNGLLHRAIIVLVFNSEGKIYMQQRSETCRTFPSRWTISVTGHVSSGESYFEAAKREVKEELGVSCTPEFLLKFQLPMIEYSGYREWEFLSVFSASLKAGDRIFHNDEVKGGKFVDVGEIALLVKNQPELFTPDALQAFDRYYEWLKARNEL
jgi:isopentenyl-diphosphate Delta-isomerase